MTRAVVIGGGFFGVALALQLARRPGTRVTLLDSGPELLGRASRVNQARVHQGYHYCRAYPTAYRSRRHFSRFVRDYEGAIRRDFHKLYAIARHDSKVSARGFVRFCQDIGAPLEPAPTHLSALFDQRRIEAVYLTVEYAFDHSVLRQMAVGDLAAAGVEVRLNTVAEGVAADGRHLNVELAGGELIRADTVLNCTYSRLNTLRGPQHHAALKHELAELALMQMPPALRGLGVTVMDGPFFSTMPYPSRELHTLTHVRYTPHQRWEGSQPPEDAHLHPRVSQVARMQRDAERFLPAIADARHVESLYEIKTVLISNEADDGRPILWRSDPALPGYHAVLGAKLDNIYDLLEQLEREIPRPQGATP